MFVVPPLALHELFCILEGPVPIELLDERLGEVQRATAPTGLEVREFDAVLVADELASDGAMRESCGWPNLRSFTT